eukprot:TRINITY_DN9288_c0_g1_i1.p1 TRINITY_DN9288_c0_g1~~TRINITY_DN9288_c0_g1_i1.p1  ORF type:complete len:492 (+),score=44.52 TRINITY_DN9288_c0_g1_i1:70-1476(+)
MDSSVAAELQKLQDIFDMGFIQDEEFDRRKEEILSRAGITEDPKPTQPFIPEEPSYEPPQQDPIPTHDWPGVVEIPDSQHNWEPTTSSQDIYHDPQPDYYHDPQSDYHQDSQPDYYHDPKLDIYQPNDYNAYEAPTSFNRTIDMLNQSLPLDEKGVIKGFKATKDVQRIRRTEPEPFICPDFTEKVIVTDPWGFTLEFNKFVSVQEIASAFQMYKICIVKTTSSDPEWMRRPTDSDGYLEPGWYRLKEDFVRKVRSHWHSAIVGGLEATYNPLDSAVGKRQLWLSRHLAKDYWQDESLGASVSAVPNTKETYDCSIYRQRNGQFVPSDTFSVSSRPKIHLVTRLGMLAKQKDYNFVQYKKSIEELAASDQRCVSLRNAVSDKKESLLILKTKDPTTAVLRVHSDGDSRREPLIEVKRPTHYESKQGFGYVPLADVSNSRLNLGGTVKKARKELLEQLQRCHSQKWNVK